MNDKSKRIFGNEISKADYRKALRTKQKYTKKYGDDSSSDYSVKLLPNSTLHDSLGVYDIRVNEGKSNEPFDLEKVPRTGWI